jgi:hypothetical protein
MKGREPISSYFADANGDVRLGVGYIYNSGTTRYYVKLKSDKSWRLLTKIKHFDGTDPLKPVAFAPEADKVYATGEHDGRTALWFMDLTDREEPRLIYSNLQVDVSGPTRTPDQQLVGVLYETDRPAISYVDDRWYGIMDGVNRALPESFNYLAGVSDDRKLLVIGSDSDVDAGSYYLLDTGNLQVRPVGTMYPELKPERLGRMRSISYKATDGKEIPGYLTVPVGAKAEKLPLIVMPHGGASSRDSWAFDFLRAFLVDRGYVVLQMNYRGSWVLVSVGAWMTRRTGAASPTAMSSMRRAGPCRRASPIHNACASLARRTSAVTWPCSAPRAIVTSTAAW